MQLEPRGERDLAHADDGAVCSAPGCQIENTESEGLLGRWGARYTGRPSDYKGCSGRVWC